MATASPNILVVEDDRETRTLIAKYLRTNACNVTTANDGREMVRAMTDHRIDLLILDVMLPGEDGLSLCRKVRAESQMPIIMLTARGEDVDRILGLEMGADDYLPKPFNPRELLARINAVLRRQAAAQTVSAINSAAALTFLGWRIDFRLRELRNPAGARVAMTSAEFDLLRTFCERPGRVLSRDSLLDLTQGRNAGSFERSIDVLVSRIRRKIEPDPQDATMIKTVRSGGYMFTPAVDAVTIPPTAVDHEAARFSQSQGYQRTDRRIGGHLDRRHSFDSHRDLSPASAGPGRSVDRPRTRSACGRLSAQNLRRRQFSPCFHFRTEGRRVGWGASLRKRPPVD
jgi:two-component system, OmpR family, response regulator